MSEKDEALTPEEDDKRATRKKARVDYSEDKKANDFHSKNDQESASKQRDEDDGGVGYLKKLNWFWSTSLLNSLRSQKGRPA